MQNADYFFEGNVYQIYRFRVLLLNAQYVVFLESNGFTVHIQTIRDDIDSLVAFGMDIEYVHNKGYHLKSRLFSLSILKLLPM